jgi:hypothetical protein
MYLQRFEHTSHDLDRQATGQLLSYSLLDEPIDHDRLIFDWPDEQPQHHPLVYYPVAPETPAARLASLLGRPALLDLPAEPLDLKKDLGAGSGLYHRLHGGR